MTALILRGADGRRLPLDPERWHGPASGEEEALLATLRGPVLDVGCGPGRIVLALARHGVVALGVDPTPSAVLLARQRGCPVLQRSVFDPLPGEGRWATVVLLDGNIGIGGDPVRLLRRCAQLARPAGRIVVEVQGPGTSWHRGPARLERGMEASGWFAWSVIGVDALPLVAARAALAPVSLSEWAPGRWLAHLVGSKPVDDAAA